ncbi:hypothetical protein EYF80_068368 [Liparis tanakae]|uniref:Uncharacterized protein n=1 Tax=Liparis tanakae TaxID=230148 RepID=A0A4Z2DY86_9TELE|nr:hypothetical protein EYF80_068368 [Liparis tanakae]
MAASPRCLTGALQLHRSSIVSDIYVSPPILSPSPCGAAQTDCSALITLIAFPHSGFLRHCRYSPSSPPEPGR